MKESTITKPALLSTLWIFATLNYLYCDIMGLMDMSLLQQYLTGSVNGMQISENFLLGAAILMEIPMAMVFLSRVLKPKVNRIANIASGSIMTLVQIATLFVGSVTSYYLFCSLVEIATTASIVYIAFYWSDHRTKEAGN